MTLLVHSSLRALDWVVGGPLAVVDALASVVGPSGTVVMPTHTLGHSEPSLWRDRPVPQMWWPIIRDELPPFDPARTPSRGMGAIAETFRTLPGVARSGHPIRSFCARGPLAGSITERHPFPEPLGDDSPLGRIYEVGGYVLLLGVGHEVNTSLHLSEHRARWPGKRTVVRGAPVERRGERVWVTFRDINTRADDFAALGTALDFTGLSRRGDVAGAAARLVSQPALVDFGVRWIERNR